MFLPALHFLQFAIGPLLVRCFENRLACGLGLLPDLALVSACLEPRPVDFRAWGPARKPLRFLAVEIGPVFRIHLLEALLPAMGRRACTSVLLPDGPPTGCLNSARFDHWPIPGC